MYILIPFLFRSICRTVSTVWQQSLSRGMFAVQLVRIESNWSQSETCQTIQGKRYSNVLICRLIWIFLLLNRNSNATPITVRTFSLNRWYSRGLRSLPHTLTVEPHTDCLSYRIKSSAICTLPTSHWWSAQTSCSNYAVLSLSRWDVRWPVARVPPRLYSRCRRRPVPVSFLSIHFATITEIPFKSTQIVQ